MSINIIRKTIIFMKDDLGGPIIYIFVRLLLQFKGVKRADPV